MSNGEERSNNKDTCPSRISFAVLEVMSLGYVEDGMWIERCREECHQSNDLEHVGIKLSNKLEERQI